MPPGMLAGDRNYLRSWEAAPRPGCSDLLPAAAANNPSCFPLRSSTDPTCSSSRPGYIRPGRAKSQILLVSKMQWGEGSARPFKQRKSLAARMHEVTEIRIKYPNKIPVVVERYHKEKNLPALNRTKFLVSQDLPLSQFAVTLRTRLYLASSQTFYLLVDNRALPSMTATMQELYREHRDEDGFLYLTYASQEVFGHPTGS